VQIPGAKLDNMKFGFLDCFSLGNVLTFLVYFSGNVVTCQRAVLLSTRLIGNLNL